MVNGMHEKLAAEIKQKALEAGKLDNTDGRICQPNTSERYKALCQQYPRYRSLINQNFVDGHRGYKLDLCRLKPFSCKF